MNKTLPILIALLVLSVTTLVFAMDMKDEIRKTLKEHPEILFEIIKENPREFMDTVQQAVQLSKQQEAANQAEEEQRQLKAAFANPLTPEIRKDETIRGNPNAPIVLVEYSDFQCPYCARGSRTVKQLMDKYDGKIAFVYKHMPLGFHAQAMPAAQYYEAIRLQNEQLAFAFHDQIFADGDKVKNGEPYLKEIAKKLGVNMKHLNKTLKNKADFIQNRIKQDIDEAAKFGFQGTPGFLLNGVSIKGAYPLEYFDMIIAEMQKENLLKL